MSKKIILHQEVINVSEPKEQHEKKQDNHPTHKQEMSFLFKAIFISFFGGIFWSFIGYLNYLFSFSVINPNMLLDPWALGDWKDKGIGVIVSIFLIGVLSIIVGLLYYVLLKKFKTIWIGFAYGLLWWAIVFVVLNPLFPNLKTIGELPANTIISSLCIYILYGVFIGYSISFEAAELQTKDESTDFQTANK